MGEYKSRSNDPRITGGAKKDKYKYDMALEVARQPADTPERKRMKKDAQNYVRAFESRFQNEAFVRSGGPYREVQLNIRSRMSAGDGLLILIASTMYLLLVLRSTA